MSALPQCCQAVAPACLLDRPGSGFENERARNLATMSTPVIDFHVHMLDEHVFKACTNKTVFTGFGARPAAAPRPGAVDLIRRMMQPETEIEDMDARGI